MIFAEKTNHIARINNVEEPKRVLKKSKMERDIDNKIIQNLKFIEESGDEQDEETQELTPSDLEENEKLHLLKEAKTHKLSANDKKKLQNLSMDSARGNSLIIPNSSPDEEKRNETSTSLKSKDSSHKRCGRGANAAEEECKIRVNSTKRRYSSEGKDDRPSKKFRSIVDSKESEILSDFHEKSRQLSDDNVCQNSQFAHHYPQRLIAVMYQLELSIFCFFRKLLNEPKYSSTSLKFVASDIESFNDIVLRQKKRSIYIKVEYADKSYTNDINYDKLFTPKRGFFSVNNYLDSFAKQRYLNPADLSENIKYLVIYTNLELDITEEKKLKHKRYRNFYPFEFDSLDLEETGVLKDLLFVTNCKKERGLYQFSKERTTREELMKRLQFSASVKKEIEKGNFSQDEIKGAFLDKLVFAVNQPNRDELHVIIKRELAEATNIQYDYLQLREKVLNNFLNLEKDKKLRKQSSDVPGIIYEFHFLMFFIHEMFTHKKFLSVNFEGKSSNLSNDITINYRNKIVYLKFYNSDTNIDFRQLFFSGKLKEGDARFKFSVNRHFTFFLEELSEDVKYFMIYSNVDLDITEEKRLKCELFEDFYPLKFDPIDVSEKRFKIFRNFCTDPSGLYQFSQEEGTREEILQSLKFPPSLEEEEEEDGRSNVEKEMKERFIDKLIFAVKQPNVNELIAIIRNSIDDSSNVPYNFEELQEVALRWSESHKCGPVTKEMTLKLLEDVKSARSSNQEAQVGNIAEVIKFAKSIVGQEGTVVFDQFLSYLIKENTLEFLKRNGISPSTMSNILARARSNALRAFQDLFDLWFDEQGNQTFYLKTLEENGIKLTNMSSILSGVGANAAEMFKNLIHFWFDAEGNKTQCLQTLEKEGINLSTLASILSRVGASAVRVFKDLYDLWFDPEGNKTLCLRTLEKNGVKLSKLSSILSRVGATVVKVFQDLYDLWFDARGKKTRYLKSLEKEGVSLHDVLSILSGARTSAAKVFKDLCDLWFDDGGNKTPHLETLERNGVNLVYVSGILSKAGPNASKVFKELYDHWFDDQGEKTQCIKILEEEGIRLNNVTGALNGTGSNAVRSFKDLYNLWFDVKGRKTPLLKSLEREGISLMDVFSILNGAGPNASRSFKDLYNLWFDQQGEKKDYLKTLEENGISLANVSGMLSKAGSSAARTFKDLHDLWFDSRGNKTKYLEALEGGNLPSLYFGIFHGTGSYVAKAFKSLHELWFDKRGLKGQFLENLEEEGVNLTDLSAILQGAGSSAVGTFKNLYNLWYDADGRKMKRVKALEETGVDLAGVSRILSGAGSSAGSAFQDFYNLWFDDEGSRTQYLETLEKEGVNLGDIAGILNGTGVNAVKIFGDLYDLWFDEEGNKTVYLQTLKRERISLADVSRMLSGAGLKAVKAFKDLHKVWFDKEGNKTSYLEILQEEGTNLSEMLSILNGAGSRSAKAFRNLHQLWFDEEGRKTKYLQTLEQEEVALAVMSRILNGAGSRGREAFEDLYDVWFDDQGQKKKPLKHFVKKKKERKTFTLEGLSNMLSGAGANAKEAFEELHKVCFDDRGKRARVLVDFFNSDFEPSDLSCFLSGAGSRASFLLGKLHMVCFDDEDGRRKFLEDFDNVGFRPHDLCRILSGSPERLERFYFFCFNIETKVYLSHFLDDEKGFRIGDLSEILQGARTSICLALRDFHDVCFDEAGNRTKLLDDFLSVGFETSDLSRILSMAGKNASFTLRNFHTSCFNEGNYLTHFLAESELFTPRILSRLLDRGGINVCSIFEKLHKLCFDEEGNKTAYVNRLIERKSGNEIFRTLCKKVRKASPIFLDERSEK